MSIFIKKILLKIQFMFYIKPLKNLQRKLSYYSINQNPSFLRLSSKPFISGDTFRNYSDHIFDETRTLRPKKVKKGDIVFLKTDLKEEYFSKFHNKIKNPYILITHNSDACIEARDLSFIDENIHHWFAMKLNLNMNDKISPLPAGLENYRYLSNGNIKNFTYVYNHQKQDEKIDRILCSFNSETNKSERQPLMSLAKDINLIDTKMFNDNLEYLKNLSQYKYNLCPEGNNFESHRLWETLFFENIPIVKNNMVNANFIKLGVPLILLNDWGELTSSKLLSDLENSFYNKKNKSRDFLYFDFWKNKIEAKRLTI